MELAEDALKDIINPDKPKEITPELIIEVVAEHFGVSPEDITSKKRNSEFVQPRQVVMYLCRKLTDTSYVNIGKLLGKKDHTTIIHGVNKIEDELKNCLLYTSSEAVYFGTLPFLRLKCHLHESYTSLSGLICYKAYL